MSGESFTTLAWKSGCVRMLDQRLLPGEEQYLELTRVEDLALAIEDLAIRGAPAIGCAAALGVALGATASAAETPKDLVDELLAEVVPRLARTRPTAVNLFWALDRMKAAVGNLAASPAASVASIRIGLVREGQAILEADLRTCRELGRVGVELVPDGSRVLTHCNAGALATAGYGTALGVLRAAVAAGRRISVLADETRPLLQGGRLTAWELMRDGIPVEVCTDSMAGHFMQRGEIDLVVVGADRIAANGDVANKIGTYSLAVLARAHAIPFYVAAPLSTIDRDVATGAEIPIEIRDREEVARIGDRVVLPPGVAVRQPAFDVTPAALVTALITEKGLLRNLDPQGIANLFD